MSWEDEGWEEPAIEESIAPDRTSLVLKFVKKQEVKTSDIAQMLGLSVSRTRTYRLQLKQNKVN